MSWCQSLDLNPNILSLILCSLNLVSVLGDLFQQLKALDNGICHVFLNQGQMLYGFKSLEETVRFHYKKKEMTRKQWHATSVAPCTSEKYWREGHSNREELVKERTLWRWTLKSGLYLMSGKGDEFEGGGSRIWRRGRRRPSEKNREGSGPIAAGMDQCSSWEQWGWLIGHHEGGSGFALPDVIGKQKQNCSVSENPTRYQSFFCYANYTP